MFDEQNEKINAIKQEVKTALLKATPTPIKLCDVTLGHSKNNNGNTIIVEGKALFKFMTEKGNSTAMATFDYIRNTKGSRKPYVTLNITFYTSGVEFNDIVNFVDTDGSDKFYSTDLFTSKVLFSNVEQLIQPLILNDSISLTDYM